MLFDLITSKYHKNENSAKMLWQGSRVVVFFLHFNTASTLNWETYSKIATFFFFFSVMQCFHATWLQFSATPYPSLPGSVALSPEKHRLTHYQHFLLEQHHIWNRNQD